MKKEQAIQVSNLSKSFKLPTEKSASLKQALINRTKGLKGYKEQKVLKGISFNIEKGDFFGIVGRNGSGKSTLLKLLAGIYEPDKGTIKVNGSIIPFIELGVGFNHELTGRENIYLNGALLGFSTKEIDVMYDDIVDFAELHEFMGQKLKNYSSGMQVRLAFSIAIKAQGDILILDEVLAVGDEAFQKKCNDYFESIRKDKNKTVILVTHAMESVRKYCNKAIMIRDGSVVIDGNPEAVADKYSLDNLESVNKSWKIDDNSKKPQILAEIVGKSLLGDDDQLQIKVRYRNTEAREVYVKIVIIHRGTPIMCSNSKILYKLTTDDKNTHVVKYELPLNGFNQGECSVVALLVDSKQEVNLATFGYDNELIFRVKNTITGGKIGGIMKDLGKVEMVK